LTGWF